MDSKGIGDEGDEKKDKSPKEMGMDIDRFIVEKEYTLERDIIRIRRWSVMGKNILIILLPCMKLVPLK